MTKKEQSQERRAKVKAFAKVISAMSAEKKAEFDQHFYHTIEGHTLSGRNQILLAMQGVKSSTVGGFQQWKRAGRQVRQGEHGASICIPLGTPKLDDETSRDPDSIRFGYAIVFGIDQTEDLSEQAA